jgi:hypothetical protein
VIPPYRGLCAARGAGAGPPKAGGGGGGGGCLEAVVDLTQLGPQRREPPVGAGGPRARHVGVRATPRKARKAVQRGVARDEEEEEAGGLGAPLSGRGRLVRGRGGARTGRGAAGLGSHLTARWIVSAAASCRRFARRVWTRARAAIPRARACRMSMRPVFRASRLRTGSRGAAAPLPPLPPVLTGHASSLTPY